MCIHAFSLIPALDDAPLVVVAVQLIVFRLIDCDALERRVCAMCVMIAMMLVEIRNPSNCDCTYVHVYGTRVHTDNPRQQFVLERIDQSERAERLTTELIFLPRITVSTYFYFLSTPQHKPHQPFKYVHPLSLQPTRSNLIAMFTAARGKAGSLILQRKNLPQAIGHSLARSTLSRTSDEENWNHGIRPVYVHHVSKLTLEHLQEKESDWLMGQGLDTGLEINDNGTFTLRYPPQSGKNAGNRIW